MTCQNCAFSDEVKDSLDHGLDIYVCTLKESHRQLIAVSSFPFWSQGRLYEFRQAYQSLEH